MILDFFFNLVNQKKQRFHFNEFMSKFHDFVHDNKDQNEENVITVFVKDLKSKFSLIFFDEFQVTNIVDAMILGKLFQEIFNQNIKVIVTSNTKISELYKDGLQRDQFKPFIQTMQEKSIEHELIIDDDYRKSKENEKHGSPPFLGEDKEWLIQYCKEQLLLNDKINYFIFGHRHLPIEHQINDECFYINLGDWIEHCTYALLENNKLELKKFN